MRRKGKTTHEEEQLQRRAALGGQYGLPVAAIEVLQQRGLLPAELTIETMTRGYRIFLDRYSKVWCSNDMIRAGLSLLPEPRRRALLEPVPDTRPGWQKDASNKYEWAYTAGNRKAVQDLTRELFKELAETMPVTPEVKKALETIRRAARERASRAKVKATKPEKAKGVVS